MGQLRWQEYVQLCSSCLHTTKASVSGPLETSMLSMKDFLLYFPGWQSLLTFWRLSHHYPVCWIVIQAILKSSFCLLKDWRFTFQILIGFYLPVGWFTNWFLVMLGLYGSSWLIGVCSWCRTAFCGRLYSCCISTSSKSQQPFGKCWVLEKLLKRLLWDMRTL